jgi:hypothetical protein
MRSRLTTAWNAFWFAPAPALNLAAARVVIAVHALWILGSRDLAATSELPAAFWSAVPLGERWRFLLLPSTAGADRTLQWLAAGALIAAAVGVWPRTACFVAAVLLYHLAPLETIYWTPNPYERGFTISILALVVLAASRSGDRLAWPRPRPAAGISSDYRWPCVLVQVFVCQVYLFAGYSKIFRVGLDWADGVNLRRWLLVFAETDQVRTFSGLTVWVANQPALCSLIAVSTLALDLFFIAMLFWPRLRGWIIGVALLFHAGIAVLMGIVFLNTPQLLVFVDWNRLTRPRDLGAERLGATAAPATDRASLTTT